MTPYRRLHTAARPYAERDVAANPLRDNYPPGEREHEIRLTQAAYASTAVTQGREIAEIAARHEGGRGSTTTLARPFCHMCREYLAPEQTSCPFCDETAVDRADPDEDAWEQELDDFYGDPKVQGSPA